jgi:hypothetical protein
MASTAALAMAGTIGAQLYGNFGREDLLMQVAAQIERGCPEGFGVVPPIHVAQNF